ncbi:MAG: hypothetical protein ACM3SW_13950 [Actinomycetota bacterium]
MVHSLDELVSVLDRLMTRIDELESRLAVLESQAQVRLQPLPQETRGSAIAAAPSHVSSALLQTAAAAPALAPHPIEQIFSRPGASTAPVVGRVFLGLAGAYVLRALVEWGTVPILAIAPVALAYAGLWLIWGARAGARAPFAGAAYSAVSALIFAPMLWELTVRFKVLPDAVTALLLVLFATVGCALAWKSSLTSLAWTAMLSVAATAFGLLIATRDPAPFVLALIAAALLTEAFSCLGHGFKTRSVAAVSLDSAVAALVVVYTAEQGIPPEYQPVSLALLLAIISAPLLIYAGSTVIHSAILRRGITVFDIGQTSLAFVLAWLAVLRVHNAAATVALGAFCLAAAAGCYFTAFARFDRRSEREYHVFASWAAALLVLGCWLLLPSNALSAVLAVTAFTATYAGVRYRRLLPQYHGALYLAGSGLASGLLFYIGNVLFARFPGGPSWSIAFSALMTLGCYAAVWKTQDEDWQHRLVRLLFSTQLVLALAALSVLAFLAFIWGGPPPNAARLAVVRTLVICGLALALALAGARHKKPELVWTAYAAMAICTLKLLWEDLRTGSTGAMAVSLFLYGIVWLVLPRIVRSTAQTNG